MKVVSALPAESKTANFTPHPAQSPNALPRESSYSLQLPPLVPVLLLPIFLNVMEGQTDHGKHLTSSVTHSLQRGLIFSSHFNAYTLAVAASQRIHFEGNHVV